tara:strand:+ start:214 stop:888 length:675 start_codon:yes stop_codon:yes gene_type:complete
MIWQDKGFLLSNIKYNENSSIAEFFTENNGKVVGIIFGASSKKLKSYLLVGNNFHINSNIRENGKIGNFKVEIDKVKTPFYLDNKKKLYCIIYAMNILKILTVENQKNKDLYKLINYFFNLLEDDNWLLNFLFWELQIFKNIGYDINFSNYAKKININADEKFIVESNNKIIPNYLINKNENPKNKNEIIEGFNIVGDFLDKSILKPNNLNYPSSRYDFINLIK